VPLEHQRGPRTATRRPRPRIPQCYGRAGRRGKRSARAPGAFPGGAGKGPGMVWAAVSRGRGSPQLPEPRGDGRSPQGAQRGETGESGNANGMRQRRKTSIRGGDFLKSPLSSATRPQGRGWTRVGNRVVPTGLPQGQAGMSPAPRPGAELVSRQREQPPRAAGTSPCPPLIASHQRCARFCFPLEFLHSTVLSRESQPRLSSWEGADTPTPASLPPSLPASSSGEEKRVLGATNPRQKPGCSVPSGRRVPPAPRPVPAMLAMLTMPTPLSPEHPCFRPPAPRQPSRARQRERAQATGKRRLSGQRPRSRAV